MVTATSLKAASYVTARQKQWIEAIQERINFTSHVLGSMKSVKMLGLAEKFEFMVQSLRIRELELSKRFRRLSSFNVCLSEFHRPVVTQLKVADLASVNVPQYFSRFLTFATFAIVAQIRGESSFSMTQAIASLAILNVLMNPLSMMIYAIPQTYAALGCFRRIEEFLLKDSWHDKRTCGGVASSSIEESPKSGSGLEEIELQDRLVREGVSRADFVAVDASFGWTDGSPVVSDVKFRATKETSLTLILGPVGCGKSTLLKGLLGEASILRGSVWITTKKISFCDHNPWLFNGSIRENIIGTLGYEKEFYKSVVHACALNTDLEQLPDGDETNVGSKGVTLSGGQKQRIVGIITQSH